MLIDTETLKDAGKLFLVFLPLLYFFFKGKGIIIKDKRLALLIGGFSILVAALFLDFTGDITALNDFFILGANFPFHEHLESILGAVGFIFFSAGIALEISYIKKDNLEKQRMIQKLQEQTEQLKKFDQLKSKFIQDVSHEFQSPLTNIRISLNNIIEGLMGEVPESQKGALNMGKRNIERLARLATDVLTLSQIESGKVSFRGKAHDISSLAQEAYLSLKSLFDSKAVSFSSSSLLADPVVWCDGDKIIQVLVNLLSNAVRYSPAGGRITLRISEETGFARVEIEDQGPGISQENLEKLFNRFERIKEQRENGTGLGLAISKEIISLHHGRIWAESSLGQGTRMIFTIPKHPAAGE